MVGVAVDAKLHSENQGKKGLSVINLFANWPSHFDAII